MLGDALGKDVDAAADSWRAAGNIRRLWSARRQAVDRRTTKRNGSAGSTSSMRERADIGTLRAFAEDVRAAKFRDVVLLGMGGSSLGPEVLALTFGRSAGLPQAARPRFDRPAADAARSKQRSISPRRCSSSRANPAARSSRISSRIISSRASRRRVGKGEAGAPLRRHHRSRTPRCRRRAERDGFRHIFFGDPSIGGRYSVLSKFGLVPAAAIGLDVGAVSRPSADDGAQLRRRRAARCKSRACNSASPGRARRQARARQGDDHRVAGASRTSAPGSSSSSRNRPARTAKASFRSTASRSARLRSTATTACSFSCGFDGSDASQDAAVDALANSGTSGGADRSRTTPWQIAQEFFRWEMATAVAGAVIGIDPFDQPDVEASKVETRDLTDGLREDRRAACRNAGVPRQRHRALRRRDERPGAAPRRRQFLARQLAEGASLPHQAPAITRRFLPISNATSPTSTRCKTCAPHCATICMWRPASASVRGSCTRPARPTRAGRRAGCSCRSPRDDAADLAIPGHKATLRRGQGGPGAGRFPGFGRARTPRVARPSRSRCGSRTVRARGGDAPRIELIASPQWSKEFRACSLVWWASAGWAATSCGG